MSLADTVDCDFSLKTLGPVLNQSQLLKMLGYGGVVTSTVVVLIACDKESWRSGACGIHVASVVVDCSRAALKILYSTPYFSIFDSQESLVHFTHHNGNGKRSGLRTLS